MQNLPLTETIRGRALDLGFERVGFAPAGPAARAALFRRWLDRGFHGEMDYLARKPEARSDPTVRDGWARSVVSVGMNYLPERGGWADAPGVLGRIARYAAGGDYHVVMKERLGQLLRFVQAERPGTRGRIAVDTSAVLERDVAEAAGVGWAGKNTLVIDPALGSWFFLGELILDCELGYAAPAEDRCGTCRACLDACPTGAILEERVLDATRCISYLTIELRDGIPRDLRSRVGGHLFGCDICQEVCPWNRDAPSSKEPAFRPNAAWESTSLADLARLTEEAFRESFAATALRRAGRRGLVRNALVVAANTADAPGLDAAAGALFDPDPVIRGTAAWALGRRGGRRDTLERALGREPDDTVREEISAALGDQGSTGISISKEDPVTRTG